MRRRWTHAGGGLYGDRRDGRHPLPSCLPPPSASPAPVPVQLVMDITPGQKLRVHAPKLLVWAAFEGLVISFLVLRVSSGWVGGWVRPQPAHVGAFESLIVS